MAELAAEEARVESVTAWVEVAGRVLVMWMVLVHAAALELLGAA